LSKNQPLTSAIANRYKLLRITALVFIDSRIFLSNYFCKLNMLYPSGFLGYSRIFEKVFSMVDTHLIASALSRSSRLQHLVANHCTCYRGNTEHFMKNNDDLHSKYAADFHERILRSFLVTGCIRTSVRLVKTAINS